MSAILHLEHLDTLARLRRGERKPHQGARTLLLLPHSRDRESDIAILFHEHVVAEQASIVFRMPEGIPAIRLHRPHFLNAAILGKNRGGRVRVDRRADEQQRDHKHLSSALT